MKINFDTPLKDFDGKPIKINADTDGTLANVCVEALMAAAPGETASGEEKLRRYQLASRLHAGGEVEISLEDAVLLKDLTGKVWPPIVVGQVWPIFDGD